MDSGSLAPGDAPPIKASTTTPAGPGAVGLLILASLAAAAVGHGGHYRRIAEVCGALLLVAGVLLFGRYRSAALQPSRWAVVGIGVMIACTELTGILDGHPSGAVGPVSLLAALAVVVAGTAVLDGPSRRQLADLVLALGVFLAGTAWLGVAFHLEPLGHPDGGLWRAATTVTYANAAAAVLGPLALWGLARTTTTRSWPARLAVVVLVSGLCATLSRAGIASFVVGLAVLIWMLGFRSLWSGAGLAVIGGLVAAVGLIPGMPPVTARTLVGRHRPGPRPGDRPRSPHQPRFPRPRFRRTGYRGSVAQETGDGCCHAHSGGGRGRSDRLGGP